MTSIERGKIHIVCVNEDSIESSTHPNEVLAARWLIVKKCPLRKDKAREYLDFFRELLDELDHWEE